MCNSLACIERPWNISLINRPLSVVCWPHALLILISVVVDSLSLISFSKNWCWVWKVLFSKKEKKTPTQTTVSFKSIKTWDRFPAWIHNWLWKTEETPQAKEIIQQNSGNSRHHHPRLVSSLYSPEKQSKEIPAWFRRDFAPPSCKFSQNTHCGQTVLWSFPRNIELSSKFCPNPVITSTEKVHHEELRIIGLSGHRWSLC